MEQPPDHDDDSQQAGANPINLEVVRSYLTFAKNAITGHKFLVGFVTALGLAITFATAKYLPKTYLCQTVMMTVSSGVLDSERGPQPLAGAAGMIMSHDSLERLVKDINLKKTFYTRRPPLLALKDRMLSSVFGPMDDKTLSAVLVGTLESKITVTVDKDTLTIDVQWSDGQTAAEIADAARESFLRIRHAAEMSAFQDKMAILDAHAVEARAEIATLAVQMKDSITKKKAELTEEAKAAAKANGGKLPPTISRQVRVTTRKAVSDEQLPELRQRLLTMKQQLSAQESDRQGRIRDEQTKLNDLMLKLTPSHPQVMTQQERVAMASGVSSELALARSEVADLESQIRQREAMQRPGSSATITSTSGGETAAAELPTEILGLLDEKDADPALAAQISGAVVRYGSLRDDIRGAKLALDTAQAAFSRRYQVTVPVDVPDSPIKPKKPVVIGTGFAISLLFALLLPILLAIKRDVVVERWQVNQLQLPVLAELRLPPARGKD